MKTIMTSVADASKLDRIEVSLNGEGAASWLYTSLIEATFTMSAPIKPVLTAADYPVLAAIWDNEDDAVYDDL